MQTISVASPCTSLSSSYADVISEEQPETGSPCQLDTSCLKTEAGTANDLDNTFVAACGTDSEVAGIAPAVYYARRQTDNPVFPVSISPKRFTSKPRSQDFVEFTSHIKNHPAAHIDGPTLVDWIRNGCIFSPAVYQQGEKSRSGWLGQQLIVIDLDDGNMDADELNTHLADRHLKPNLIYTSWSHSAAKPKFHVCFLFDGIISDMRLLSLIISIFKKHFPDADPKVLMPQANVNGSYPDSILLNDFSYQTSLHNFINDFLVSRFNHDKANFAKWLTTFCRNHYLYCLDDTIDMSISPLDDSGSCFDHDLYKMKEKYDLMYGSYNIYTHTGNHTYLEPLLKVKIPFKINQDTLYKTAPEFPKQAQEKAPKVKAVQRNVYTPIGSESVRELQGGCALFNQFMSGTLRLDHNQRFGLETNLAHSRDGLKYIKQGLESRQDYGALAMKKAVNEFKYIERAKYRPMKCSKMNCPYLGTCQRRGMCPIHQIPIKRHSIRRVAERDQLCSMENTRLALKEVVAEVYSRNDTNVYVIACDTGVGKTEAFLSLPLKNTYVGFPTHRLKNEAMERAFGKALTGIFDWPKRPLLPDHYETILRRHESLDLGGTMAFLRHVGREVFGTEYHYLDYLKAIMEVKTASLIFGTHDKAFHLNNPNINTFIIDEDFSSKIFDFSVINPQDVKFLMQCLSGRNDASSRKLYALLKEADQASFHQPTINTFSVNPTLWHGIVKEHHHSLTSPVISLTSCYAFMRSVSGNIIAVAKRKLRTDAKYIIFSATADKTIYESLFGDRLRFIDLRGTRAAGKVIMHREYSYSKQCIERIERTKFSERVIADQKQWKFDGIITYKEYARECGGEYYLLDTQVKVFAWFGNLEGYDHLKGKNIAIYGVPHFPEEVYRLFAFMLTGQYKPSYNQVFAENVIVRNGWEFTLMSSPDPLIQKIQLHTIESQLIQAVGRSRYLTEDCNVHLFGNFPLPHCDLAE